MSECNHDCSSCGEACSERTAPADMREKPREGSNIKKVIAVVSGKGGVGKSMVTSLLACSARAAGHSVAIMDADITGPSIPKAFGVHDEVLGTEESILPCTSRGGIKMMSLNLLMKDETDPVVWRSPIITGTVRQFWTEVDWGDVDYMFVDMPPGTGDVPLTVFQTMPVDGVVVVASPQELVGMIVEKAVKMARMMNIPVLALVENMSYVECPDCGKRIYPFGESRAVETAARLGIDTVCAMPIKPELAAACDAGEIERAELDCLDPVTDLLERL